MPKDDITTDRAPWIQGPGDQGWVSVIIPTYNRADQLDEVLDSVWTQTWRPIELIVVDDGSTDDTAQRMEDWQRRHADNDAFRTRYIQQDNRGAASARNTGGRACRGEFILWHDSDDIMFPSRIKRVMDELEATEADMCCCGSVTSAGRISLPRSVDDSYDRRILLPVGPHMWMFRRSLLEKTAPWNESIIAVEDAVFMRECLFGTAHRPRIALVRETLYEHRVAGQDRVTTLHMKKREAYEARFVYCRKRLKEIRDRQDLDDLRKALVSSLLGLAVHTYETHQDLHEKIMRLARAHGSDRLWGRNAFERTLLRFGGVRSYRTYWRVRQQLAPAANFFKRLRVISP